jgi:putative ABC transport system permease protein
MVIFEMVLVALGAIRAQAMRAVLTTLGIVIGIASVIAMVALGEGARLSVEEEINQIGASVLTVRPGQQFSRGISRGDAGMSVEDAEALRDGASGLITVSPEQKSTMQVTYLKWNAQTEVLGVWPEYFDIYSHEVAAGRYFDQGEVQGKRRVAVLGHNVPATLGDTTASVLVGQDIQLKGVRFEVIGVLEEKGDGAFMRPDDQIFIPQSTAQYRVMGGKDDLGAIYAATETPEELDLAYAEIDRILRREHRLDPDEDPDFNIRNSADLLQTFNETNRTFGLLLAGIAGVSLLVGGIGIMNIMLVSVTERTREIGVRKAMGATRREIMAQFLIEALTLCLAGGLIGVAFGYASAELVTRLSGWTAVVAPEAVGLALACSAGIGLLFGLLPARRASRMSPIDALRFE